MTPSNGTRAATARIDQRRHATGVALVLTAGAMLSLAGITLRHIESAGGWQILFYRSLTFFVVVALYLVFRYRTRVVHAFVTTGRPGLVVALSLGLGSACYVFALLLTTVANAVFIISSAPFMTAILGWIVLRERVRPVTWIAMTIALAGIAVMMVNGIQGGRLIGNLVALGPPVSFAIMLVTLRRAGDRDMIPAICLAGFVGAALGFVMADSLVLSRHDLALCLFLGIVQYTGAVRAHHPGGALPSRRGGRPPFAGGNRARTHLGMARGWRGSHPAHPGGRSDRDLCGGRTGGVGDALAGRLAATSCRFTPADADSSGARPAAVDAAPAPIHHPAAASAVRPSRRLRLSRAESRPPARCRPCRDRTFRGRRRRCEARRCP